MKWICSILCLLLQFCTNSESCLDGTTEKMISGSRYRVPDKAFLANSVDDYYTPQQARLEGLSWCSSDSLTASSEHPWLQVNFGVDVNISIIQTGGYYSFLYLDYYVTSFQVYISNGTDGSLRRLTISDNSKQPMVFERKETHRVENTVLPSLIITQVLRIVAVEWTPTNQVCLRLEALGCLPSSELIIPTEGTTDPTSESTSPTVASTTPTTAATKTVQLLNSESTSPTDVHKTATTSVPTTASATAAPTTAPTAITQEQSTSPTTAPTTALIPAPTTALTPVPTTIETAAPIPGLTVATPTAMLQSKVSSTVSIISGVCSILVLLLCGALAGVAALVVYRCRKSRNKLQPPSSLTLQSVPARPSPPMLDDNIGDVSNTRISEDVNTLATTNTPEQQLSKTHCVIENIYS